ncbi:MAG: monovalent cation:proton antiporter-2 (CPA2) family protein [Hyphomicrobium sp.]
MANVTLTDIVALLAALAIAAPLAQWLGIGRVLGYLGAGVILGPYGVSRLFSSYEASEILHFAEFGVVLLLFLIGLELRPKRLWAMRSAIFGLGGLQVGLTGAVLGLVALLFGLEWRAALFTGFVLALSSTAFALQVLEENGELSARHGRLAFAVLLFQDLAAIPLIALAPLFAVAGSGAAKGMDLSAAIQALAVIGAVVLAGHFLLDHVFRWIARTKIRDAMTAAALLTVVGVSAVMQQAGVSASLGAFLAGALLSESSYRHQLEADLKPFEGLLLGLFFTAIGMSLNLALIVDKPLLVIGLTAGLVLVKMVVLTRLGRGEGLEIGAARRLGLVLSQGGEFGFLLLTIAAGSAILARGQADLLAVVITLSMAATPLLLALDEKLAPAPSASLPRYDTPPDREGHVIIAGFGRFGQITARVLRGKGIPFTALDISAEQVELVKGFGAKAFFGDASRADILDAAQADKARAIVIAIDDIEASMRTAALAKETYPNLPVLARARNRNHAHRLLDLGVTIIERETFLAALEITRRLLKILGHTEKEAERLVKTFRAHDERRLIEDYKHYSDIEKMQDKARSDPATLKKLFEEDAAEQAKIAAETASGAKTGKEPKRAGG